MTDWPARKVTLDEGPAPAGVGASPPDEGSGAAGEVDVVDVVDVVGVVCIGVVGVVVVDDPGRTEGRLITGMLQAWTLQARLSRHDVVTFIRRRAGA